MQPYLATLCIYERLRERRRGNRTRRRPFRATSVVPQRRFPATRSLSVTPVASAVFFASQSEPHRGCDVARGQRGLHLRAEVRGQEHLNLVSPIAPRGTRYAAGSGRVARRLTEPAWRRLGRRGRARFVIRRAAENAH